MSEETNLSEKIQTTIDVLIESGDLSVTIANLYTVKRQVAQLEVKDERLKGFRNELEEMLEPNEPHDMGGPHISLHWIIERLDALKEGE